MMIFFVVLVIASLAVCSDGMTMAEQKQMLLGIAQECKATEDASDEDLSKLVEKKPPTTREGKCLFACIMENMDLIQNGKFDKTGFQEYASVMFSGQANADKMKAANELVNECEAIADADRCELAFKAGGCLKIGAFKRKIDIGF